MTSEGRAVHIVTVIPYRLFHSCQNSISQFWTAKFFHSVNTIAEDKLNLQRFTIIHKNKFVWILINNPSICWYIKAYRSRPV